MSSPLSLSPILSPIQEHQPDCSQTTSDSSLFSPVQEHQPDYSPITSSQLAQLCTDYYNLPPLPPRGSPLSDLLHHDYDYVPSTSPVDVSPYFQPLLRRIHPGRDFATVIGDLGLSQDEVRALMSLSQQCCDLSGVEDLGNTLSCREKHLLLENIRSVETILYVIPSLMRSIIQCDHNACLDLTDRIRGILSSVDTMSYLQTNH
jgi:hypothetical protein